MTATANRIRLADRLARIACDLDDTIRASLPLSDSDELCLCAPAVAHLKLSLDALAAAFHEAEPHSASIAPPCRNQPQRIAPRSGRSNPAGTLIDLLTDAFGAPIVVPQRPGLPGLWHFPCPVCGGGIGDNSLLPYRPLTVSGDGKIWCAGMIDRTWARASCSFTPERLARALDGIRTVAA